MRTRLNKTFWILRKCFAVFIAMAFLFNTVFPSYAQTAMVLPVPGTIVTSSAAFTPVILKAVKVHPENPFQFEFIVDVGSAKLSEEEIKTESQKLIRYFLASLTIPENDLWVNLSPYEKDRIVPQSFGVTEMGRDLLGEDYILKQLSASLTKPDTELGKRYWEQVNKSLVPGPWSLENTNQAPGTNHQEPSLSKVWIVPQKAVVYENGPTAYVSETKLKVMMEEEYEKKSLVPGSSSLVNARQAQGTNHQEPSTDVFRQLILPQIEQDVNEGKNFAAVRQIYNSLILANWYKKRLKDSILSQIYVDKKKVAGVDIDDKAEAQKIYDRYLEAFKKGVYNYIKEDYDPATDETIPRKYFSGGLGLTAASAVTVTRPGVPSEASGSPSRFRNVLAVFDISAGGRQISTSRRGLWAEIKNIFSAATLGGVLALTPLSTQAVTQQTASIYKFDTSLMKLNIPTIPQAQKIVDGNLSEMLTRFQPKYAALNPDPQATWLKQIISQAKSFDDFSKGVREALANEKDPNRKSAMQIEFLRAYHYFITSTARADLIDPKDKQHTSWRLKTIIEGNPLDKNNVRTYVCQNASLLTLVLFALEFGWDVNSVSVVKVLINFEGQDMEKTGGHVANMFTLANGRILLFDLAQQIIVNSDEGLHNLDMSHKKLRVLIWDKTTNVLKPVEIVIPSSSSEKTRILSGKRGNNIAEIQDVQKFSEEIDRLQYVTQPQAVALNNSGKPAESLNIYRQMIMDIDRLLANQQLSDSSLLFYVRTQYHKVLRELKTATLNNIVTAEANIVIAQKNAVADNNNANNVILKSGFDFAQALEKRLDSAPDVPARKKIADEARKYLDENRAKLSEIKVTDAKFFVNKQAVGGEYIISRVQQIIDRAENKAQPGAQPAQPGSQPARAVAQPAPPKSITGQFIETYRSLAGRLEQIQTSVNAGLNLEQDAAGLAVLRKDWAAAVKKFEKADLESVDDGKGRTLNPGQTKQLLTNIGPDIDALERFMSYKRLEKDFNALSPFNSRETNKIQALRNIYVIANDRLKDRAVKDDEQLKGFYKGLITKIREVLGEVYKVSSSPFRVTQIVAALSAAVVFAVPADAIANVNMPRYIAAPVTTLVPASKDETIAGLLLNMGTLDNSFVDISGERSIFDYWTIKPIIRSLKSRAMQLRNAGDYRGLIRFFIEDDGLEKRQGAIATIRDLMHRAYSSETSFLLGVMNAFSSELASALEKKLQSVLKLNNREGMIVELKDLLKVIDAQLNNWQLDPAIKWAFLNLKDNIEVLLGNSQSGDISGNIAGSSHNNINVAPGGIDLTAGKTPLEIRARDNRDFRFQFTPAQIKNIQIDGLVPVIINITPEVNLPLFLSENSSPSPGPMASKLN